MKRRFKHIRKPVVILALIAFSFLLLPDAAQAIPAWSRKYDVNCQTCHTQLYPRLNLYGERFLANGYQDPDNDKPDGDAQGKKQFGSLLALDKDLGHWFTARLNLTPIQVETKAVTVNGEKRDKITFGNTNWLQLFVAGSIAKNVSIYIENEFTPDAFHQAWYYLGLHNFGGSSLLNVQLGRLSPVIFAPYPDRLPQIPAVGGGVMRIVSSAGGSEAPVDMRSPRYGAQYYGYQGPLILYGGLTPGSKSSTRAGNLGYWAGVRFIAPEGKLGKFEGSSIAIHYDGGTDSKGTDTSLVENTYSRIMPGLNIRYAEKFDLQAAYVLGTEDNRNLSTATPSNVDYDGVRAVASYFINNQWALSAHFDQYKSDPETAIREYQFLYVPVPTYSLRENFRISLYPGFDLKGDAAGVKHNVYLINIRTAI